MNFCSHPLQQVLQLVGRLDDATVHFSEYSYRPQEVLDERRCFDLTAQVLSEQWLIEQLNALPENKELAFHSLILINKKSMHLPMIDFCCPLNELDAAKSVLSKLLPTYLFASLKYYSSGRSIHAYGSSLLRPTEWRDFMGTLLLANLPDRQVIVDTRWIGHRILGGYSSLRFSCNSKEYLQYPKLII